MSNKIVSVCPICGKSFERYPSKGGKYCSHACSDSGSRAPRKAPNEHWEVATGITCIKLTQASNRAKKALAAAQEEP